MATYYSSKLTLAASTALFTDSGLVTPAPNGYYSSEGIVRQQTSGELISGSPTCAICEPTPYTVLSLKNYNVNADDSHFIYNLSNVLPFAINVSNAKVKIYSTLNLCNLAGTPAYEDTSISHSFNVGASGNAQENGSTAPVCSTVVGMYYHIVNSVNVTIGIDTYTVNNGDILTVGGYDIFIQLYQPCFKLTTDCTTNAITACYSVENEESACCDCIVPTYEMNLCMSTVSCNNACIDCV